MAPVLGYWDIRGLATPIRLMLSQAGVEYEEKLYHCGGPPDFDRSNWLSEKFTLGLDFPNLPYLIDGDVKITQSRVIIRHLARKHGFMGKTEKEQLRIELLDAQVHDFYMDYVRIVYNPQFESLKADYVKGLPAKFEALSKFIESGKGGFAAGDYVTYADFFFFEYLETQLYFNKEALKDYPVLDAYHKRILALEGVDKYFKSDKAIKFPFSGAIAYFGGAYSDELQKSAASK